MGTVRPVVGVSRVDNGGRRGFSSSSPRASLQGQWLVPGLVFRCGPLFLSVFVVMVFSCPVFPCSCIPVFPWSGGLLVFSRVWRVGTVRPVVACFCGHAWW